MHTGIIGGGLLLDVFYLLGLLLSIVPLLNVFFEMTISNQDLNGILEVDAVFCSVPVDLVEPTVFGFISVGLDWCFFEENKP